MCREYQAGIDDLFLVYTGKQLNSDKSFREEFVENNSELICVKCEEYRINKKVEPVKNKGVREIRSENHIVLNNGIS